MTVFMLAALLGSSCPVWNFHMQVCDLNLWPDLSSSLDGWFERRRACGHRLGVASAGGLRHSQDCCYNVEYDDDDAPLIRETKLLSDHRMTLLASDQGRDRSLMPVSLSVSSSS